MQETMKNYPPSDGRFKTIASIIMLKAYDLNTLIKKQIFWLDPDHIISTINPLSSVLERMSIEGKLKRIQNTINQFDMTFIKHFLQQTAKHTLFLSACEIVVKTDYVVGYQTNLTNLK